ncbi:MULTISPECIES: hypothetical protein [unclassified Streptomyces]|uniref:hypothetical protein n=1 Tax=unclassified Streptomyces TaxID=2593676 RepID=UPI0027E54B30|nr:MULTISPECIES: hypothetical protein [unclassified Streptomyces]MCH0562052.1 hypothetical protein [Streptomyces sp. MUM 2J]MCH0568057.1 hypothetical protein [Streptomyces sp. MUM 136J]
MIGTCVLAANSDGLRFAELRGSTEVERYVRDGGNDTRVDLRPDPAPAAGTA